MSLSIRKYISLFLVLAILIHSSPQVFAQEDSVDLTSEEESTTTEVPGFTFEYPGIGRTKFKLRVSSEQAELLNEFFSQGNTIAANIMDNQTIIDEENKVIGAIMEKKTEDSDIKIAYTLEGANKDIVKSIFEGNVFAGEINSELLITRTLNNGSSFTLRSTVNSGEDLSTRATLKNQITEAPELITKAKGFMRVTRSINKLVTNSQGVKERANLTSGKAKVREKNVEFLINGQSFIIPIVIIIIIFKNCPTIIDRIIDFIDETFGGDTDPSAGDPLEGIDIT